MLRAGAVTQTNLVQIDGVLGVEKRLTARFAEDPELRERLVTEARIVAALSGRGAPRLLALGEDAQGPWFVMEHRDMRSLADRMDTWGDAPSAARVSFVDQLVAPSFAALEAVHRASDSAGPLLVVHGDVSPDNVLASDDAASSVLVDFGLAHFRDAPASTVGAFRGTARYVAPEVARGEPPRPDSDRFSLALTLLHAATGEPPRAHTNTAALIAAAGSAPVTAFAERATRGMSGGSAALLLGSVALAPEDRSPRLPEAPRTGS